MAKPSKKSSSSVPKVVAAAPVPMGKKKTFTDADLDELDFGDMDGSQHSSDNDMTGLHSSDDDGPSGGDFDSQDDDEEDSDDDGAPEEETLAHGREEDQERRAQQDKLDSDLKEARRLASTKRALASQAKLAPPPARKPRTPKPSSSSVASTSAAGGPSYLPDELFESAAADQQARLAREADEAAEASRHAAGEQDKKRKRHERDDRLNIGTTSIRHLPSSVAPHLLTPAPTPRRVRKFLKSSQQQRTATQAQSYAGKSKLAVGGAGKSWVRKEAHLTVSQKNKGPAVGFATGRLV